MTSNWEFNDNLPPISPESRLLQPRNTDVKGRVPEEIRVRSRNFTFVLCYHLSNLDYCTKLTFLCIHCMFVAAEKTEKLRSRTKAECNAIKDKVFNQFAKRLEVWSDFILVCIVHAALKAPNI